MYLAISCQNFWDEAWWSLSVGVFRLLSSSLLFFSNVSAAVSSGLSQVLPVYLGIEMIQPGKSFFLNSQTLKIISQFESFLYPDKQGTPEEGRRIHRPKRYEKKKTIKTKKIVRKLLLITMHLVISKIMRHAISIVPFWCDE